MSLKGGTGRGPKISEYFVGTGNVGTRRKIAKEPDSSGFGQQQG
ncbi:hypothetical protein HMPREF9374_1486 [Desmospora sp. 8437]|nr:hypothetical protein HMPREF9374_1486 [Desmospora sp. 8437]